MSKSKPFPYRVAFVSLLLIALPAFSACSHKAVKSDDAIPDTKPSVGTSEIQSSDAGNAQGLQTVRFVYDSSSLSSEAKGVLNADAAILKNKPSLRIQIEGHCDQRGGIQYNIALGERRATSVKHYLEDRGVDGGRIATISYGKERPLDPAETEEAYAKNRRANFVITNSI